MKDNEISLLTAQRPNAVASRLNMNARCSGCSATVYVIFYKALSRPSERGKKLRSIPGQIGVKR